jgi:predicted nucleic acid-binding protein
MLRTLDGIHLASAVVAGANRLVSTDHRMREAAVVAGLSLWPMA